MSADAIEEARRQARLESILDAALHVFSEGGFEGLTIQQVADRAGIAKGTVYLYFDDKESLVADAIWRAFEAVAAEIETIASGRDEVQQRLEQLAKAQLAHIQEHLAFYRALMRTPPLDREDPEADPRHRVFLDLHRRVVASIEGVVRDLEPPLDRPTELAWAFQHLVHGASVRLLTDPGAPEPATQARYLVGLVLDGAAAAEEGAS